MNVKKILNKKKLSKSDLVSLISTNDAEEKDLIFFEADRIKNYFFGNEIHLRGIIEFSNYCRQDCYYCGIRLENENISRYRMNIDQILYSAELIYKAGIRTIVLQSGEDVYFDEEKLSNIIKRIKSEFDVAITLSLGERTFREYETWKRAGADRYLLKHETADPDIYFEIHPYQEFDERIKHLKYLKSIGYQVGSGNIIGLPGQTIENIADDIILCKELDVDMASFSPFISAENTPFQEVENCDIDKALIVMAVARIYLKNVHIPATTALSTIHPEGRKRGLKAGANVIMPTYTPNEFRFQYSIYKDKPGGSEPPSIKLQMLENLVNELDLQFSSSKGHSLKSNPI